MTLLRDLAAANPRVPSLLHDLGLSIAEESPIFGNQNIVIAARSGAETVALKVPHYAKRPAAEHWVLELGCHKEAQVLSAAECGRLPRLHAAAGDGSWLLREWVTGRNLDALLSDTPNRAKLFAALVDCAIELFDAFHSSARGAYILRDFKPANLICDADGRLRMIDVGSIRRESDPVAEHHGHYVGTGKWRHWPPEFLSGDAARCDRRVDIFAFGVAAFRVLTREFPFTNSCTDVKRAYADEFARAVHALEAACEILDNPPFWRDTLRRCLDPNPEVRPGALPKQCVRSL